MARRVAVFVDGFNMYHALKDRHQEHIKWLNLWELSEKFVSPPDALVAVRYFSAYATWRPGSWKRHRVYVDALSAVGVIPVMGRFKKKPYFCATCQKWIPNHEEKETDVNIGVSLLAEAVKNTYDVALLVSADSDLVPAVRVVRELFPQKEIRIVAPVERDNSAELIKTAGGPQFGRKIKALHVERSLFSREVRNSTGEVVATRPMEYDPPTP